MHPNTRSREHLSSWTLPASISLHAVLINTAKEVQENGRASLASYHDPAETKHFLLLTPGGEPKPRPSTPPPEAAEDTSAGYEAMQTRGASTAVGGGGSRASTPTKRQAETDLHGRLLGVVSTGGDILLDTTADSPQRGLREGREGGWLLTEEDETAAVALLRELDREVCAHVYLRVRARVRVRVRCACAPARAGDSCARACGRACVFVCGRNH